MIKKIIKKLFNTLGYNLTRTQGAYRDYLLYEADSTFNQLYDKGLAVTSTPDAGHKRRARFYNLLNLYNYIRPLEGRTAECGCWKGLSSYLICSYEQDIAAGYKGGLHEIYDSFAGLSLPTESDVINDEKLVSSIGEVGGSKGDFFAEKEFVRKNLAEFPEITLYQGWIPQVFETNPNANSTYKFVHIDVDLYEPVYTSLCYFYPKLNSGGVIVCDDYGSLRWPGAKKAVEQFCRENNIAFIALSTGQAIIFKSHS